MKYFTNDFMQFFKELAANNNKNWFDENRKRYEKVVKDPFKVFINDLIEEVAKDDKTINLEAKDAIFRINRDIRFSKDKTPYKLNRSALISRRGKKDRSTPGLYVQLNPEEISIYGGTMSMDRDELYDLREYMMENSKEFNEIIGAKTFKATFGELHGDKNKVIPKEFKKASLKQPLLYNKSFYYFTKFRPELATSDKLMSSLIEAYKVGKPMKEFLTKGMRR